MNKKRVLAFLICTVILLTSATQAFATDVVQTLQDLTDLPMASSVTPGQLPAKSAILIEQNTGYVLYEHNADEKLAPASVTKIMTMLLVFDALEEGRLQFTDLVTTSPHANSMGGTQIWLEVGEQMTVHELLKAVATVSANDAAVALAEHIAGSEEGFAELMNERAAALGMRNTNFVNASGLDVEGHYTTARDIAIMSRELLKYPKVTEYTTIWLDSLRNGETQLVNTNKLVRFYKGATGLKTGTTNAAGHCLSATATRGDLSLVAVVMGSKTSDDRFASARGLLDYGFANFEAVTPPDISAELVPVKVLGGEQEDVMPILKDVSVVVARKGQKDLLKQEVVLAEDLKAPVENGQKIGEVILSLDGTEFARYPIVASEAVEELTVPRCIVRFLANTVKM